MFKKIVVAAIIASLNISIANAAPEYEKKLRREKVTIALDWFINADHAPIFVAQQIGAFKEQGIDVDIIEPKTPTDPTTGVANHKTDLAVGYQPEIYTLVDKGLPIVRIGTLINQPLNMVAALPSAQIKEIANLKGKKIGYASGDKTPFTLKKMLASAGLTLNDVTLVNVGFKLVSALENKSVDAVYEVYRNIEGVQFAYDTKTNPVEFYVENYGIPRYDELVIFANKKDIGSIKIAKFMQGLKKGTEYLLAHPEKSWRKFAMLHPELNTEREHATWNASLQYFAHDPIALNKERYRRYRDFSYDNHLISKKLPVSSYAVKIHTVPEKDSED